MTSKKEFKKCCGTKEALEKIKCLKCNDRDYCYRSRIYDLLSDYAKFG